MLTGWHAGSASSGRQDCRRTALAPPILGLDLNTVLIAASITPRYAHHSPTRRIVAGMEAAKCELAHGPADGRLHWSPSLPRRFEVSRRRLQISPEEQDRGQQVIRRFHQSERSRRFGQNSLLLPGRKLRKSANDAALGVTRGLDPRVHPFRKKMDCRVKPGNDASFMTQQY